jgi:thioredoxin-related protein
MYKFFAMKYFFALVSIALVFSISSFKKISDPLPIGSSIPHPEVKMKNIDGSEVSFQQAMGKNGLLVMFSCNTCPIVHKYQSRTLGVCKYALGKNIGVVLLNSNEALRSEGDSYNDMKDYAKEQGYRWNYLLDERAAMADAFGASRTPEVFLFDEAGKLIYHGAIDNNQNGGDEVTRNHLQLAIDEHLQGKEVSVKTTRSVGCNIKRF